MPVSVCKGNTARGIGKHFGKKISRKISFWKTFWTQSKFISLIINVIKIILENFLQIRVFKITQTPSQSGTKATRGRPVYGPPRGG